MQATFVIILFFVFSFWLIRKLVKKKEYYSHTEQNDVLWKTKYDMLIESFDNSTIEIFYDGICELGELKFTNTAIPRRIYFQSHQFLAPYNAAYSLMCYLHYLNVKTPTTSFRHRTVSKELSKLLFKNKTEETKFLQICDRLKADRKLDQALENTKLLFRLTRREIQLDASAIEEADRVQSQVAKLLGKYLEDTNEISGEAAKSLSIAISPANDNETGLFQLFEQNNFVLNKKEIDTFASERGVFRDSLIQQINETYYNEVEDVLIEDETDHYTLNKIYYKQIRK